MKASIDVADQQEAQQIERGLSDPAVRAFVRVMGVLSTLESQRAKHRVMNFVIDHFDELDRQTVTGRTLTATS